MRNVGFSEGRGSISSIKHIGSSEVRRSDSLRKISSALRVEKASDAVADAAIGTKLKMKMQSINQVLISSTQINSTLDVADSALSSITALITRMRTLAEQAAGEQLSDSDREKINKEFLDSRDEIDRIAKTTEFNNMHLLSGSITIESDKFGEIDPSDPDDVSLREGFLSSERTFGGGIQNITFDSDSVSGGTRFEYDAETKKLTAISVNTGESEYVVLDEKDIEDGKTEKYRFHQMKLNISLNSYFDKTKSFGMKYADKLSQTNENNALLNVNYDINSANGKFSINPMILREPLTDEKTGKYLGADGGVYGLDLNTTPNHPDYIDYDTGKLLTWDTGNNKYINKLNDDGNGITIRMVNNERKVVPVQNIDGSYQIMNTTDTLKPDGKFYVANDGHVYLKGDGENGTFTGNVRYQANNGVEIKIEVEEDLDKSSYTLKNGANKTVGDATSGTFTFDPVQHILDKDGYVYDKSDTAHVNKLQTSGGTGAAVNAQFTISSDIELDRNNMVYKPKNGAITRKDEVSTLITTNLTEFNNKYDVDGDGYVYEKGKTVRLQNQSDVKVKMKNIQVPSPYITSLSGNLTDLKSFDVKMSGTFGKSKLYLEAEDGSRFESEFDYNITNNEHDYTLKDDDGLAEKRLGQGIHEITFKRHFNKKGVDRIDTLVMKIEISENSTISYKDAMKKIPDNTKVVTLNELKNTSITFANHSDSIDLVFKVGASEEDFDRISVRIEAVTSARLGMDKDDFEIKTRDNVPRTKDRLDGILEAVLMRVADIAVAQNRVEKTIDNLANTVKNAQLAASAIFDLDIPSEMVNLSQFELQQSAAIESLSRELKAKQNLLKLF